jgi:hypothetical protein
MENDQHSSQDEPVKDVSPAGPVDAGPESATEPASPQAREAAFDDPESLDEDDTVITGDDQPPVSDGQDPGDDPDVPNQTAPEQHTIESVEADQNDQRGEGV